MLLRQGGLPNQDKERPQFHLRQRDLWEHIFWVKVLHTNLQHLNKPQNRVF